jgi:hypothetical protein
MGFFVDDELNVSMNVTEEPNSSKVLGDLVQAPAGATSHVATLGEFAGVTGNSSMSIQNFSVRTEFGPAAPITIEESIKVLLTNPVSSMLSVLLPHVVFSRGHIHLLCSGSLVAWFASWRLLSSSLGAPWGYLWSAAHGPVAPRTSAASAAVAELRRHAQALQATAGPPSPRL